MVPVKYNNKTNSGGRKTANVIIKLQPSSNPKKKNVIIVNSKLIENYFQNNTIYLKDILKVFKLINKNKGIFLEVKVTGGGLSAQAQAIRLAFFKLLVEMNPRLKTIYKKQGFLTRDARIKERRKYGLKKARRAPQFSKR
uniref:ribosomal protein S9 n=1 Tax=Prototheca fontanea TaxID=2836215 RepID=UPI003001EB98